jgi:hypothetical protein
MERSCNDELKKKIVTLASTIRKWNKETEKVRKTVKEQIEEIVNLGLNKYNMERNDLRKLVETIFRYHGISESWLRKVLPVELKDSSKTRISYQQRKEIERERQRLLLQRQASESQQEISEESSLMPSGSEEYETGDSSIVTSSANYFKATQDKLYEANRRIEILEKDLRMLSEPFIAKTYLETTEQDIPLIVQIDPVKKAIISIQIEKATSI